MKKVVISVICAGLLSGCSGGQGRAKSAVQADPKPAIPYAPGIEWQFSITPSVIDLGDVAKIELRLTNSTDSPVTVDSDIFGHFSILIEETSQHFQLAPVASARPPGKLIIASGATEHISCSIFTTEQQYRPDGPQGPMLFGLLVPKKGKYLLQLLNRGNVFTTVQIEIR